MLKIGVLGHNLEDSQRLLKEIIDSEREQNKNIIIHPLYDKVWISDDLVYRALSNNPNNLRGLRLDQLIVGTGNLDMDAYIEANRCLVNSCVPEEFLIQVFA